VLHVDAACSYRRSSVVCLSVCRSVCRNCEPWKNGWADRDTVWVVDSVLWTVYKTEVQILHGKGQFWMGEERPILKYRDYPLCAAAVRLFVKLLWPLVTVRSLDGLVEEKYTYARRAFSVAGSLVWNSLPDYLRDPAVGRDTFSKHLNLKTFLFAVY